MLFSLRRKLVILILIIFVPLVAVAAYNLATLLNDLQNEAVNDRNGDARLVALSLNRFTHETAAEEKAAGVAIVENKPSAPQANSYLAAIEEHIPIADIFFTDQSGRIKYSGKSYLLGKNVASQPAFKTVVAGSPMAVSGLLETGKGQFGFAVYSRIEQKGRLAGIVGAYVDSYDLSQVLVTSGAIDRVIIVTDSSGMLVFSSDSRLSTLPRSKRNFGNWNFIRTPLRGRNFMSRATNLPRLGGAYIGAQVPVAEIGWTAGFFTPASPVTAQVLAQARFTIFTVVLIILLSVIAALIYTRAIVEPIDTLARVSAEVGKGNFDASIDIRTQDEIGGLAANFEQMKDSLKRTFSDLSELNLAGKEINSRLEVASVARIAIEHLKKIIPINGALLTLFPVGPEAGGPWLYADGIDERSTLRLSRTIGELSKRTDFESRGYAILRLAKPGFESLGEDRMRADYLLLLPLIVKNELIGRIDVFTTPTVGSGEFEQADVPLAAGIAQQVSVSIENAKLFESQKAIADILQESLLTKPQLIPGVEVGVAYLPSTTGTKIGGDFYDFFPVSSDKTVIVIGDVTGKGIRVAALTSIAKGAIRSFALEDPMPHSVLSRASKVIAEQTSPEIFVTAVYMLIDLKTGSIDYSIAGHPPPLLYSASLGRVFPVGGGGVPLGTELAETYGGAQLTLSAGDKLVLYTDGLTEARQDGHFFGEERAAEVLYELKDIPARKLAERVAERAVDFSGGRLVDDLAVVSIEKKAT